MEESALPYASGEPEEIPLFPLNVVLFPGMSLPLHIFEERYKTMIGECLERDTPFGILLIKEGSEVGAPAEPYTVGTTARITQVERLEGGRLNLGTEGRRRFDLLQVTERLPYLKGLVRYLQEPLGSPADELVEQMRHLFRGYIQGLAGLRGGWVSGGRVPEDCVVLSYAVAQFLDSSLQVRQRLLELPTAQQRLEEALPLLKERAHEVRRNLERRTPYQGFRLN